MTSPDLSKMTKDELLRLAAKRRIPVKNTMLKSEIVAVLKRAMKKAVKPAAPKKSSSKPGKGSAKKPSQKSPGGAAKSAGKRVIPATAVKPKTAKTATTAKKKVAAKASGPARKPESKPGTKLSPTSKSATKAKSKHKKPTAGRKPVTRRSTPALATPDAIRQSGTQALHPKFELEDSAQEAKFIVGKPDIRDESHEESFQDLPANYGDNKLVLLVRDPYWCYLYWELQGQKIEEGLRRISRSHNEVRHILRIHSASAGDSYFDVDIDFRSASHYIQLSPPGASFYSEIGLLDENGNFAALAVSNTVTLPLDGPSDIIDEQWMTSSENFDEIYSLSGGRLEESFGPGGSADMQKARSLAMDFSSSSVSSFGAAETPTQQEATFNYWLDAEVVLFGGADPGSTIELSGKSLTPRPDGTFTARLGLPEGTLELPITFISPDRSEVHTIKPKLSRKTEEVKP